MAEELDSESLDNGMNESEWVPGLPLPGLDRRADGDRRLPLSPRQRRCTMKGRISRRTLLRGAGGRSNNDGPAEGAAHPAE